MVDAAVDSVATELAPRDGASSIRPQLSKLRLGGLNPPTDTDLAFSTHETIELSAVKEENEESGVFASFMTVLPSVHTGGGFTFNFQQQQVDVATAACSRHDFSCIAW